MIISHPPPRPLTVSSPRLALIERKVVSFDKEAGWEGEAGVPIPLCGIRAVSLKPDGLPCGLAAPGGTRTAGRDASGFGKPYAPPSEEHGDEMDESINRTDGGGNSREPEESEIKSALAAWEPRRIDPEGMKIAGVLIPILKKDGKWHVVLTRRTDKVEHHKGEISFPGGHYEEDDPDLEYTALRETEEEIGVPAGKVRVLGRLDDKITITGFRIRPYVGVIPYPIEFTPQEEEIAEILILPLSEFMKPENLTVQNWKKGSDDYPVYFYRIKGYTVWGATAKILKHFLEVGMGHKAN